MNNERKYNLQTLKINEVVTILGINRHTLYELIHTGEISAFRCGKQYRIAVKALEDYMSKNKVA